MIPRGLPRGSSLNALLKPKEIQLKLMWRDSSIKFANKIQSGKMNVYILQVMSILVQNYCSPKYLYYLIPGQEKVVKISPTQKKIELLVKDVIEFKALWNRAVQAIESSIHILYHPNEYGITSHNYIPYVSILPVFSALQSYVKDKLSAENRLDAHRKIRQWYWASIFTNRYSGSVESTSARDFMNLIEWFRDSDLKPSLIQEFKERYRYLDLRKEVKKGSSIYNGIFNLLILSGAKDWITGVSPNYDDIDDHHIVPNIWGKENGIGTSINTILNRTPICLDSNRNIIRDKMPSEYIPELISRSSKEQVLEVFQTHLISPKALEILLRKDFTSDDYEEFLQERQRTIFSAIENLLIKARLDLPPLIRDLDSQIEKVELCLRELINKNLGGKEELIPPHILQKSNDRIQRASIKNPAFDLNKYDDLIGILEFFDLREIQDTILAKLLWSKFSSIFQNKETLVKKFDQLAELRNSIRHSRDVDEITMKEGEAAIIWFSKILLINK